MPATTQTMRLSDGRDMDVLTAGADDGPVIVFHHGTPSDATVWLSWDDVTNSMGLRVVAASRPGYASSSRLAGRSVAQAAADTAAVLDVLGIETFVTVGQSGGGPHAIACAALMRGRCLGAATLAGVGPWGVDSLDFLAGMGPENIEEFNAAIEGDPGLRHWLTTHAEEFRHVTTDQIIDAFGGLVPQVDKDLLTGGFAEAMAAEIRRALAPGFDGWVDDDLAFVRPWGFDLGSIITPVSLWQGDLDLMVPFAHGQYLASTIPTAQLQMKPGHGHLSLGAAHREDILKDLISRAGL